MMIWLHRIRTWLQSRRNQRERNHAILTAILPDLLARFEEGDRSITCSPGGVFAEGDGSSKSGWRERTCIYFIDDSIATVVKIDGVRLNLDWHSRRMVRKFKREVRAILARRAKEVEMNAIFNRLTS